VGFQLVARCLLKQTFHSLRQTTTAAAISTMANVSQFLSASSSASSISPEQTMRVALLEDEPIQMQLMVATLETFGATDDDAINCSQFTDGESLRNALLTDPFDLLILDWNFNSTNGLDLVRWMREKGSGSENEKALAELPVIVVSARSTAGDSAKALAGGADDYIAKPFRRGELLGRVQQLMNLVPRKQSRSHTPT
jgi:DNA-binding response OmpR family regulator